MKKKIDAVIPYLIGIFLVAFTGTVSASGPRDDLFNELMLCECLDRCVNERFPVHYNHLLYGGYFNMPSARMGYEGEIGAGYSSVPPYSNYNLRLQLLPNVEFSANYRVFIGIPDPVLGEFGFGDFADKGANIKFQLFSPEDSCYKLPGIAVGFDDITGTRSFKSNYIVATQVLLDYDMEISLGYGGERFHGWFGGVHFMPFRSTCWKYLRPLCLTAEYDAIDYEDCDREPHPDGRVTKSPINWGAKYRLGKYFDLSVSYIRGDEVAFSASTFYNWGTTEGFIPKYKQVVPYCAPTITEPLGPRRSQYDMISDLYFPFRCQGFNLLEATLHYDPCCKKVLRIRVLNCRYRTDADVRRRLSCLLGNLIPCDIDRVIVVMDGEGFPIQEYHFCMEFVRRFHECMMGDYELAVVSPLKEVSCPSPCENVIFKKRRKWFSWSLSPKTRFLFGSARGKFKYALGVRLGFDGFLWDDLYYSLKFGYIFLNDLEKLKDYDRLNPSQLVNVHSDIINYYKQTRITIDEAYLQKVWNLRRGFYARAAAGIFGTEYGGIAGELLYYPLRCCWAFGLEGALFRKRTYDSYGFKDTFRKLKGTQAEYIHFTPSQYFASFYYDWKQHGIDFRVKGGKFVADDWGARFELARYYPSGLKITLWYTRTNGHDIINGQVYNDKGIGFSMPLDVFYSSCSRERWGNAMSAWLRDVGYSAGTGRPLYGLIRDQRQALVE